MVLEDRTDGGSCLLIQTLDKENKTGDALLQAENDLNLNLEFSSHYLGTYLMTIQGVIDYSTAPVEGNPNESSKLNDGFITNSFGTMTAGSENGYLLFKNSDFNFGKVFSAEKTKLLSGKKVILKGNIFNKSNFTTAALIKWKGKPDEYTTKFFSK